jgi:hypothetical protein
VERSPNVSRNDRPPKLAVQSRKELLLTSSESRPKHKSRRARLFLNGTEVGVVTVRGHSGSWAFGEFAPSSQFAAFAPAFETWSLLMHAGSADGRLSATVSEKLRASEYELDALRASLVLDNPEERHHLRQLNIDGGLIEWKR